MFEILNHPIKVVNLIQYSKKKTNFRKIRLISNHENWYQILNQPFFDNPQSKGLTMYQKQVWDVHLDAKIYRISPETL